MDWEIFSKFIAPPVLGAVAGASTIWLNWFVEKSRKRFERRTSLIDSWRRTLMHHIPDKPVVKLAGGPQYDFLRLPEYSSLRPHLPDAFIKQLETPTIVVGAQGDHLRQRFSVEIARIEKEWGVV